MSTRLYGDVGGCFMWTMSPGGQLLQGVRRAFPASPPARRAHRHARGCSSSVCTSTSRTFTATWSVS